MPPLPRRRGREATPGLARGAPRSPSRRHPALGQGQYPCRRPALDWGTSPWSATAGPMTTAGRRRAPPAAINPRQDQLADLTLRLHPSNDLFGTHAESPWTLPDPGGSSGGRRGERRRRPVFPRGASGTDGVGLAAPGLPYRPGRWNPSIGRAAPDCFPLPSSPISENHWPADPAAARRPPLDCGPGPSPTARPAVALRPPLRRRPATPSASPPTIPRFGEHARRIPKSRPAVRRVSPSSWSATGHAVRERLFFDLVLCRPGICTSVSRTGVALLMQRYARHWRTRRLPRYSPHGRRRRGLDLDATSLRSRAHRHRSAVAARELFAGARTGP